MKKFCKNYH